MTPAPGWRRPFGRRAGILIPAAVCLGSVLFIALLRPSPGPVQEREHPLLPDVKTAKCVSCHDDLAAKKIVHAPLAVGTCDACHELENRDGRTLVRRTAGDRELCLGCHSDIEASLKRKHVHAAADEGCVGCHAPHSSDFPRLLAVEARELCRSCHDMEGEDLKRIHGRQPVAESGCGLCHDPHGSDEAKLLAGKFRHAPFEPGGCEGCHRRPQRGRVRLRSEGASLCYACHTDKEKEFAKPVLHTPVRRGECVSCHDPHLAPNASLLKRTGNALCLGCHAGVGALLKAEHPHPPAAESCLSCHDPHAAEHDFGLLQDPVETCLQCHDGKRPAFRSAHYKIEPAKLRCAECHNPHGSSSGKMLNVHRHAPFEGKECSSCHEAGESGAGVRLVESDVNTLCYSCHDDKKDGSNPGRTRHAALEAGSCTACHSPHASSRRNLVKDSTPRVCGSCHEGVTGGAKIGTFVHGIIETAGCEACHLPHDADNEALLVEKFNGLCLACHLDGPVSATRADVLKRAGLSEKDASGITKISLSRDMTRDHPQTGHPVSGSFKKGARRTDLLFEGDLTCLSCHDSHSGASPGLFTGGLPSGTQLCLKCHKK